MGKIHILECYPAVGMDLHPSAAIKMDPRSQKGVRESLRRPKQNTAL